jgi:uncharacterized protein YjdB
MAVITAPFIGCSATQVDTLTVSPVAQTLAVGQTAQFTATGTIGHGKHPSTTTNVTGSVTWSSSATAVATINSSGLVTAVSAGTTTITASMPGFTGNISASAVVTVTGTGGGSASANVTTVSVIPGTQAVASPGQTSAFIAIGTTSNGATENLTNQVVWSSSSTTIATVNSSGVATAASQGSATITALFTNPDKSVATGTATFQVIGGNSEQITALTIYPGSQSATQSQQTQFFVLGTQGSTGLQIDVSDQVVWNSSIPTVASIGTAGNGTPGLATGLSAGTTAITTTYKNQDGSEVVAAASFAVSIGTTPQDLLSINVVPAGVTVSNKGMTAQYLAFGTYSTNPTVRDITNDVTWISLLPEVASINTGGSGTIGGEQAGLATSQGYTGDSVIYAELASSNGSVVLSNPQTFTCKDPVAQVCIQTVPTPQFATITVFIAGNQTAPSGEYVTAPSDTGTPNLIHCGTQYLGSGGSVCTGTYEVGSKVTLTENLAAGSSYFGGWSTGSGCVDSSGNPLTPAQLTTSTTCTVSVNGSGALDGNISVGVIFY